MKVIVRPLAEIDLKEAFDWYELQQPGLGLKFISFVDKKIKFVSSYPLRCPQKFKNVRVAVVERFPFVIHYLLNDDKVIIISVYHTSRNVKKIKKRLE
jgi:toxin ParE1/3/4